MNFENFNLCINKNRDLVDVILHRRDKTPSSRLIVGLGSCNINNTTSYLWHTLYSFKGF